MGTPADFDSYLAEHNIPEEEWPEAFARWIAERTGGPVPRFKRVEPGDEQFLPDREQRELDAVPSFLAIRAEEAAARARRIERAPAATRARQSRRSVRTRANRRSNDRVLHPLTGSPERSKRIWRSPARLPDPSHDPVLTSTR